MAYVHPPAVVRTAPVAERHEHRRDRLCNTLSTSIEPPPRMPVSDRIYGLVVLAVIIGCLIGGAIAEAAR